MRIEKIMQAEEMRYVRIQQLIDLLFQKSKNMPVDFVEEEMQESFPVGMKIKVDVSGKGEKVLQMLILVLAVAALFFYKLLMALNR